MTSLKALVDAKLRKPKITADDAREVLAQVQKDKRIEAAEGREVARLASLPASRFERKDEFIPNPWDSEDGVTIKTNPKRWLETTVQLATAKLNVRSTIPELSFKLSNPKEFDDDEFGSHFSRTLDVTVKGKAARSAGTVDLSYGDRTITLAVKQGETMERVLERLETAILRKEGATSVDGFYSERKAKQTLRFEVL